MATTVAATMKAAAAMETTATVESVTTAEAMEIATAASESAVALEGMTASIEAPKAWTPIETPSVKTAAMEPGASSNEDAIHEPVRPVIAVGGARVRIIGIVAVGADRSGSVVTRSYPYSHSKSDLRVGSAGHRASHSEKKS